MLCERERAKWAKEVEAESRVWMLMGDEAGRGGEDLRWRRPEPYSRSSYEREGKTGPDKASEVSNESGWAVWG